MFFSPQSGCSEQIGHRNLGGFGAEIKVVNAAEHQRRDFRSRHEINLIDCGKYRLHTQAAVHQDVQLDSFFQRREVRAHAAAPAETVESNLFRIGAEQSRHYIGNRP